ncbi:MAG: DUF1844 domain-containing protein [Blastochloris sp.]|nr:DUF1844 domain-containing protein [Blastochloris sp.]
MAEVRNDPGMSQGELAQKFVQFLMMHAQNVLFVLGKIPTPDGRQHKPNLEAGKVLIDQLEVLHIKTKGNLSKQEENIFNETLTSLRMAFVEASGGTPASMMPERDMGFDMPELEEEEPTHPSPAPAPAAQAPAQTQASPAPQTPEEDPNKKKYFKSYG